MRRACLKKLSIISQAEQGRDTTKFKGTCWPGHAKKTFKFYRGAYLDFVQLSITKIGCSILLLHVNRSLVLWVALALSCACFTNDKARCREPRRLQKLLRSRAFVQAGENTLVCVPGAPLRQLELSSSSAPGTHTLALRLAYGQPNPEGEQPRCCGSATSFVACYA